MSKLGFDREGLIVAESDGQPVGFVHAAFGPTDDGTQISNDMGVIAMLMVRHGAGLDDRVALAEELLARGEAFLRERGAKVLYAGGIKPLNLFYLGLYGGSELPGILESSGELQSLLRDHDYREIDRVVVVDCDLSRFRPPVSRQQMQLRRRWTIEVRYDPPVASWWEAMTVGVLDRIRFELMPRGGQSASSGPAASATFWNLEPLAGCWGVRAAGLIDVEVAAEHRQQGFATCLVAEALRALHAEGTTLVEAQTMAQNTAALAMYARLGFVEADQGVVLRKEAAS